MMDQKIFEQRVRELSAALTTRSAPADAWPRIAARLQAGEVVLLPTHRTVGSNWLGRTARITALLVLCASAAIAALSNDVVRGWIDDVLRQDVGEQLETPPARAADSAMTETTLLVDAANGKIEVVFVHPEPGARIQVRFADNRQLRVHASGAAAQAQFRSAVGRLTVTQLPAAGSMIITIPIQLEQTTIRVNDKMYLVRDRRQLRILAPRADTVGPEIVLPLVTEQ